MNNADMSGAVVQTGTLEARALAGEAMAQYQLGVILRQKGHNLKYPDGLEAAEAYVWKHGGRCLAEQRPSQLRLADNQLKLAYQWFSKAAKQGVPEAMCQIGWMSHHDELRERDAEPIKWFKKAAQTGLPEGIALLGKAYLRGDEVDSDIAKGIPLLKEAAALGYVRAMEWLGDHYSIEDDEAEGARWYRQAAEKGSAVAQYCLAALYDKGEGIPKDDEEAFRWYLKAAEQGQCFSSHCVAKMYAEGRGVAQDGTKAVEWYLKEATPRGHAIMDAGEAEIELGLLYALGQVVPKDLVAAYGWFNLAAASMHAEAADLRRRGWDDEGAKSKSKQAQATERREEIAQSMTREEITEAQRRTRCFFEQVEIERAKITGTRL